jgi:hypothetical protein
MADNIHAWWYNVSPLNDFLYVLIGVYCKHKKASTKRVHLQSMRLRPGIRVSGYFRHSLYLKTVRYQWVCERGRVRGNQ